MAESLDKKIEKMLNCSLFLSNKKRHSIRKKLKTATKKEKQEIIKILGKDQNSLTEMIGNYIETNGTDALDNLLNKHSKNIIKENIKNLLSKKQKND